MTPGGWRLVDGLTHQVICSVPCRSVNAPGNEKPDYIWSPPPVSAACRGRRGPPLVLAARRSLCAAGRPAGGQARGGAAATRHWPEPPRPGCGVRRAVAAELLDLVP